MNLANINTLRSRAWAMERQALERIAVQTARLELDLFADADPLKLEAMYAARDGGGNRSGAVAVVPVRGAIMHRDSWFTLYFGGTSCERLAATLRQLASDESVGTILLDIDSPGGETGGLSELAAVIRQVRDQKRVVAIWNSIAASAAYWIASQANEIVANPESLGGSIGVWMLHEEWSKALEDMGIKFTWIHAGERKVDGNWTEPLSERAAATYQGIVDEDYRLFVADVATGRDIQTSVVKSPEWGEGAVLTARDAKKVGMVDRIATFTETIGRLAGAKSSGARADVAASVHMPECNDQCDPAAGLHFLQADESARVENEAQPDIAEGDSSEPLTVADDADPLPAAGKSVGDESRERRARRLYR